MLITSHNMTKNSFLMEITFKILLSLITVFDFLKALLFKHTFLDI